MRLRSAVVLASAILTVGAAAAPAGAYVYWGAHGQGQIHRGGLDGSFSPGPTGFVNGASEPKGIAVDGSHLYWVNSTSGTIGRSNLDGTGVNQSFITGLGAPSAIAVDGAHVYWADQNPPAAIGRADLGGSNVNKTFITGVHVPTGVAVDDAHVYWSDFSANAIGRANLDGTGPDDFWLDVGNLMDDPQSVAVNATDVYYTTANGSADGIVWRAAKGDTPGTPVSLATAQQFPVGIALDAQHVYWADQSPSPFATAAPIRRAKLDGTSPEPSFIYDTSGANGLAVDALGPGATVPPITPPPVKPKPPAAPAPKPKPTAARAGKASESGTTAGVTLTCPVAAGTACSVTMSLTVTVTYEKGSTYSVLRTKPKKHVRRTKKLVTVGTAKLKISAGHAKRGHVSLSSTGRKLLAKFHKLPVTLVVVQVKGRTRTTRSRQRLTFRAPVHHKKKPVKHRPKTHKKT